MKTQIFDYTNINFKRVNFEYKGTYLDIETGFTENSIVSGKELGNVISLKQFLTEEFSANNKLYVFLQENIDKIVPFIAKNYNRSDLSELFVITDNGFFEVLNNYFYHLEVDKLNDVRTLLDNYNFLEEELRYPLWPLFFRFPEYLTHDEIKGFIGRVETLQELLYLLHPTYMNAAVARQYAHHIVNKFLLIQKNDKTLSKLEMNRLRALLADIVWKNPTLSPKQYFELLEVFKYNDDSFYHPSMIYLNVKDLFTTLDGTLNETVFVNLVYQNRNNQRFIKDAIGKLIDIYVSADAFEMKEFHNAFKAIVLPHFLNAENIKLIEEYFSGNKELMKIAASEHFYFEKYLKKTKD